MWESDGEPGHRAARHRVRILWFGPGTFPSHDTGCASNQGQRRGFVASGEASCSASFLAMTST